MKVAEIMNREPVTVRDDQTFGEAFQKLCETRRLILPVVDEQGVYKGIFDLKDVWRILLPRAAHLDRGGLVDLSFANSSLETLKDHIAENAGASIGRCITADDTPPVFPDTPVIQAILMLDVHRETIAVVDRQTRKLVGVVSAWEVLDSLR